MTPRLTIVMPLKGRHLFTFRLLWHANKVRLPYRFLIADGKVNDGVARYLEDSKSMFPELDVEYVQYPDDVDYQRYFAKMADATQRVRTPYVMHADVDDFLGFHAIERALDFLDVNLDYVCARGQVLTFSAYSGLRATYDGISGKLNGFRLTGDSRDIAGATAADRLRYAGASYSVFYAIYRREVLARIWQEATEIGFSDLLLHEQFHALRAVTLGKVHTIKELVSYYSQAGTSITYDPLEDWARHLIRSRFSSDAHALIGHIADAAASDATERASVAEYVTNFLADYFRRYLSINYGARAEVKRAICKRWPRLTTYSLNRPRLSAGRERARIFSELQRAGASHEDTKDIRLEISEIERAMSPEAFAEFAGPLLPLMRSNEGREWF
jgi:glycosyltransferase domain-containing protein